MESKLQSYFSCEKTEAQRVPVSVQGKCVSERDLRAVSWCLSWTSSCTGLWEATRTLPLLPALAGAHYLPGWTRPPHLDFILQLEA